MGCTSFTPGSVSRDGIASDEPPLTTTRDDASADQSRCKPTKSHREPLLIDPSCTSTDAESSVSRTPQPCAVPPATRTVRSDPPVTRVGRKSLAPSNEYRPGVTTPLP